VELWIQNLIYGWDKRFSEAKHPKHEADDTVQSSSKVKTVWSYTSAPPVYLHGVIQMTECIVTEVKVI